MLCLVMTMLSENTEKKYKELIEKYDVSENVKALDNNSPCEFWNIMLNTNTQFNKFVREIQKKKGAEKEALNRSEEITRFYPQYDESIYEDAKGFCDTLLTRMGIPQNYGNCSLHIINYDEVNAFTALTEDGFAMCITQGLFVHKGMTYEILMGAVAHEFAHGALMHHLRRLYAEAKTKRKNRLIGGLAAGFSVMAAGVSAAIAPNEYSEQNAAIASETAVEIMQLAELETLKYTFKYSREQEFEADLIAYRFLENLGCEEQYINLLRMLGSEYDAAYYSDASDHPTIMSRIAFLKFVKEYDRQANSN